MWLLYTLLACLCFGLGAALQKHGMATSLPKLSLGLLLRELRGTVAALLRCRVWLAGIALNLVGGVFMVLAIATGELSVVQPLVNVNLLVAVLVGVGVLHERLSRAEGAGALAMIAGAALVSLSGLGQGAGPGPQHPDAGRLLAISLGCAGLVGALYAGARLGRSRLSPELVHSAAAGLLFGLGTVLVKLLTVEAGRLGVAGVAVGTPPWLLALVLHPALGGTIAVNVIGFVLVQLAFSHGRVAIISPVVAIAAVAMPLLAGVVVFGEQAGPLRLGGIAVVVAGLALLVVGGASAPDR